MGEVAAGEGLQAGVARDLVGEEEEGQAGEEDTPHIRKYRIQT